MRQVIDGRIYDTETATHICDLPCPYYRSDFKWHETGLYKTKRGAYFIAGKGGAMSLWAEPVGNNSYGAGFGIRPVSKEEAQEYAEAAGLDPEAMIEAGFELEEA